jgi:hypothetical protein
MNESESIVRYGNSMMSTLNYELKIQFVALDREHAMEVASEVFGCNSNIRGVTVFEEQQQPVLVQCGSMGRAWGAEHEPGPTRS